MIDTYVVGKRMGPRSLSAFALADRVFVIGCVRIVGYVSVSV
jgi:hypothetical protein